MLRHDAIVTYGWIRERHLRVFESDALSLFGLGDDRLSEAKRKDVTARIYGKSVCCLRRDLPLQVRERVPEDVLLGRQWKEVWRCGAGMIMMGIPDIECRHARNRQRGAAQTAFKNFAAKFCNLEAQHVAKMSSMRSPENQKTLKTLTR